MTKRQRIDSVNGALKSMEGASNDIEPPDWVRVPAEAMSFWRSITRARASDRWNDADLENAAELARTKAAVERLSLELESEDDVIMNARGTLVVNPKHALLETLTRRVVGLSRMLQVHAEATQGKSRDQVDANKAQDKARTVVENSGSLFARPTH